MSEHKFEKLDRILNNVEYPYGEPYISVTFFVTKNVAKSEPLVRVNLNIETSYWSFFINKQKNKQKLM